MADTQPSGQARLSAGHQILNNTTTPLDRPGTATNWLMLLAVLVVCAIPMLITVGRADSKRTMENIAVLSAQETWLRQQGWQDIPADPNAWLMPTRNGNPRIVKPPMVIWMDMLAWADLTPETSSADQLIFRARIVSVGMGLLTIAGVFWIGCVLRDHKMAVLSALAAGTCLFLQRQARIASYDMHMTGWATLAVASAIWAMRPFKPAPGILQALAGWSLAGVALAASYMSKGPLALLVGAAPVLCTIVVVKDRWRRHTVGLIGMLLVTALLTMPWYLYIFSVVSNAEGTLLHEYRAERMEFQHPFYYLGLFGLILPWTVWLFGGLLQPFMRSSGEDRRRLMVAWVWFVLIFIAFSIPGAKQQRYILPIMPAAALLIGQLWHFHHTLAQRGEVDPGVNLLRIPHWVGLVTASILAWPFFVTQGWMVRQGWFNTMQISDVPMPLTASAGIVLMILAALGARWHFQWKPMRAALASALWSVVIMTLAWYAWSSADRRIHPVRESAQRVANTVDGAVLGCLIHRQHPLLPNEEFLLYARRIVKPVRPTQAVEFGQTTEQAYLIAPIARETTRVLKQSGYKKIDEFTHDYDQTLGLWKYVGERPQTPADSANHTNPPTTQPSPQ